MGLKQNTTDGMPGAPARAFEPFGAADCAGYATLQLLAGAAQAEGVPYTFVGGSLFLGSAVVNIESVCAGVGIPDITAIAQNLVDEAVGQLVDGNDFEAVKGNGKLELANAKVYDEATIVVVQTDTAWGDEQITFTVVQGTLPGGGAACWGFVLNNEGARNEVGAQTSFT